ncbi:MAG: AMP-dependent synthetase [Nocardioides sp.]|nr:AMP-dependent synthetase [Nocardioides sp.]
MWKYRPMPQIDVADLVLNASVEAPDRLALVESEGRGRTWLELENEVASLATGLGRLGMLAGHRVMIVMGNRVEFVSSYLGVLRAQVVAVPVNPRSTADELARMIADSGTRLVITDPGALSAVRTACADVDAALDGEPTDLDDDLVARAQHPRIVVIDEVPAEGEVPFADLVATAAIPVPPLPDPEKLAALLYTSGTSGRPRAAMLTHRALMSNLDQVGRIDPPMIHGDDVVLGVLPLFHVYGLNAVLGGVLRHRAKLLLVQHWDPAGVLDLIEDEAVSVVPIAPPVFAQWRAIEDLADRLGPVRLVLSGSAPLTRDVIEEFTALTSIPVHQGYGLTEASPVVTSTLCSVEVQNGSVGAALPGIELRLVDARGGFASGDDPGEIQVKGDNLFSGYWPDGAGGPSEAGWWSTGDVGILDHTGDLFLVDRIKELVIVSGFNVYPSEVEDIIREVPGVLDAAVIGVEDAETGEAVVAYVVTTGADDELAESVRQHAAVRLARFKQPTRIEVVDQLPLTVTGKVQKGRLRGIERRRALGLLE